MLALGTRNFTLLTSRLIIRLPHAHRDGGNKPVHCTCSFTCSLILWASGLKALDQGEGGKPGPQGQACSCPPEMVRFYRNTPRLCSTIFPVPDVMLHGRGEQLGEKWQGPNSTHRTHWSSSIQRTGEDDKAPTFRIYHLVEQTDL